MSGPLAAAGATQEPSEYACLSMDRAITGLWTQRSALRDADVPYLYAKFYSAGRFDSLIDGINREITARLTNARRPGCSAYNAINFPPIDSYYSFKYIQDGDEIVRVIADGRDGNIYDATAGQSSVLFPESAGAAKARFLGINATLFFTNGIDRTKIVRSPQAWMPSKIFTPGQFIVDSNLNLQVAVGAESADIASAQVVSGQCTLFFQQDIPLTWVGGIVLTFSGLTGLTGLNGTVAHLSGVGNASITFPFAHADYAVTAETGTSFNNAGPTGATEPVWETLPGTITFDGSQQWICKGSSVQNWGIDAPPSAPNVANAASGAAGGGAWIASCFFWPGGVIIDSNNNIQQLTTAGTTAGSVPTWNVTLGGTTTDGSVVWTNIGSAAWAAHTVYGVGSQIIATYTVIVNQPSGEYVGGRQLYKKIPVTYTSVFTASTAGTSGASAPPWAAGLYSSVNDNGIIWQNRGTKTTRTSGVTTQTNIGNSQLISGLQTILDSNGAQEILVLAGVTGAAAPTWSIVTNALTHDNSVVWQNNGTSTAAPANGVSTYAYSYLNSVTREVSTASDTAAITLNSNSYINVQGVGSTDPQADIVRIWRTAQGKSTLIFLADILNPGPGLIWTYADSLLDTDLVAQIPAPIAHSNDRPPVGMTAPVYHMGRVWAIVDSIVINSGGPDTISGSGNSAFPPLNTFPLPERALRLYACVTNNGPALLILGTTNVYAIFGSGTANSPFQTPVIYMAGVGILNYDAVDVVGSTYHLLSSKKKMVSLDPSAGYVEEGFPIGDQFANVTTGAGAAAVGALYDPSTAYVTWHEESSSDTAVYVSDGAVGWFRFSPVTSPETGYVWSPRAAIVGGASAIQSVETSPGITQLLIGPPTGGGPIRFRDDAVNADWSKDPGSGVWGYTSYPSWDVKGSIVLCNSGELAEIAHIALQSAAVGSKPKVALLLGEIKATTLSPFEPLEITSTDPPDLDPSVTLYSDRYSALQNGVCPKCMHFQLKVDFGTQNFPDELLSFSVYGAKHSERKQQ